MDEYLQNIVDAFKSNPDGNEEKDSHNALFIECHLDDIDDNSEEKYDLSSCKAMERISYILTYYISWIQQQLSLNEIYEETENNDGNINMFDIINSGKYLDCYNNTKLLNDFHHILHHRYETIRELLVFMDGCCVDDNLCQLLVRNYRNRNSCYIDNEYRSNLYFGSVISTEITTQQILDSIHCFVYHSYDLGNILSEKQSSIFNNHSVKRETVHSMHDNDDQLMQTIKLTNSKIIIIKQIIAQNYKDNIYKMLCKNKGKSNKYIHKIKHRLTFDFGERYYYWRFYKNKYWYIESRFMSLKLEILELVKYNPNQMKHNNKSIDCGMSMEQWNDIEERSHHIHRTLRCKKMICDSSIWFKEYCINKDDIIKKEHIIAVLIFCIFDKIRNAFILTFNLFYNTSLLVEERSRNCNERGIEWMKRNHSYFANFGRLLRETVECFGIRLNDDDKSFYFGINDKLCLFNKTSVQFKLPLLCSHKMNVVLNYMNINGMNDGLLIQIKYYQPFIRYFDCSFITEFTAENEVLFNGGISMLQIETIYNINMGTNYLYFIRCINTVQSLLNGRMKKEAMTEDDQHIIRYLVQNEFIRSMNNDSDGNQMIPHYISLLFHHFCINLDFININLRRMNDKSVHGYFGIKSLFFTSQNNFIKMDVLCSLFPNVHTIQIRGDRAHNIKLDELFFEEVLLVLESNLISTKCQLMRIIILNPNEDALTLESAVSHYQSQFLCRSSKLNIEPKTRQLVIDRLDINGRSNQGCMIQ